MKIAIIVNCLKMGGMERVAVNLADACHEAGHDTDLIYLKNRKKKLNREIMISRYDFLILRRPFSLAV